MRGLRSRDSLRKSDSFTDRVRSCLEVRVAKADRASGEAGRVVRPKTREVIKCHQVLTHCAKEYGPDPKDNGSC